MGGFVEGVKDLGKGVGNAVSGAVGGVVAVAKGDSPDKYWDKAGGGVNKGISGYVDVVSGGQADTINQYTGGSIDKIKSGFQASGNLIAGKSVSQNLKDQASLILQAGQAYAGVSGVNVGGMDLTGMANDILGGLQNKLNPQKQMLPSGGQSDYNPSPQMGSYNGSVAPTNYLPYVALAVVGVIIVVLVIKKKK